MKAESDSQPYTFDVFENRIGKWQWRLFEPNGKVVTDSLASFVSPGGAAAAGLSQRAKRGLSALERRQTRRA